MARPRRVTRTVHFQYESPRISDREWMGLGQIVGVALDDNARAEIKAAVDQYIESTLALKDGAERAKKMRKRSSPIEKWCALAANTVAAWDKLDDKDDEDEALGFPAPKDDNRLTLLQFSPVVESLRHCLNERASEIVDVNTNPFEKYISQLAGIVEAAGGKVRTAGDFSARNKLSQFQEFVAELNRCLPEGAQKKHSPGALANKTHKAVVNWRRALP